ncbi:MAG: Sec-independent protein translocase protein TatB [Pseudomonadota bacterium]|nr:Sec-independent protein translocase protein TatB [Pseudomonadota bacterium]
MFDLGFSELFLIALVALVVLGPERLPKAARFTGLWVRRARAQWYSVKSELENELADEDLKRGMRRARDELRQAREELRQGGDSMRREFDVMRPIDPAPADPDRLAPTDRSNEQSVAPGNPDREDHEPRR